MRILVIEDNRDILANVLDYLQLKGFGVDCAQGYYLGRPDVALTALCPLKNAATRKIS